jgi:type II secretory pathway pseudopilin PulG
LGRQAGLTLVELLVAAAMSVVLVGAAGSMVISAMKTQPRVSKRVQNISTARYVLERMTREIRNGVSVYQGTSSSVSFLTQVRRTECGGGVQEEASQSAIQCRVTYACTTTYCTRAETAPGAEAGGTPVRIVSDLSSSQVFSYQPPSAEEADYIGVTLHIPNPEGSGELVVSDGAGLRSRTIGG